MEISSDVVASEIVRVVSTHLPTKHAEFDLIGYRDHLGIEHVALTLGLVDGQTAHEAPLVRVHSECLTGDCLGSFRCDCGEQLDLALATIAHVGRGALIYVRGHEGRGIGLLEKLRAYALQDRGVDTVDANLQLGHPSDLRSYDQSAHILLDLGLTAIRLLSSNPAKEEALTELGITVTERISLPVPARPDNAHYLSTKRRRMNHDLPYDPWERLLTGEVPTRADDDVTALYGPLVQAGPRLVIAQLGQSADGFIASRTGDAHFVTGPEDRLRLHRMRALVDAVVVGARTVIADDCQLTVRDCPGTNPVRVVVDLAADVPLAAQVLQDGSAPTLWLVGPDAEVPESMPAHVSVVRQAEAGRVDPAELVAMLTRRGLGRVLVEGGGRLVSSFVAAGALDRLYLTTSPLLIGDGVPGLRFAGTDALRNALRGNVRHFPLGEDICTELILRAQPEHPAE